MSMDVDAPLTHAILEFQVHALLEMPGLNERVGDEMVEKLAGFVGRDSEAEKE